ncbi:very long chain fatty acid elongase 6-like [Sycon ciliatum]|uniref:very long chain fatty acid elongase 6-like n=1 Tax=Sycon ciliatum TaxID=27933 RepID=UPI0020AED8BA|eukprot:scpid89574/ scgid10405/ Putative fatty acid elongation protein 3; 3-keto acyl-CoA synthase elo-3
MEFVRNLDKSMLELEDSYYDYYRLREWTIGATYYMVTISMIYVALIHWGVSQMEKRTKYNLRGTLVCWNAALAFYSMFSLYRFTLALMRHDSVGEAVCDATYMHSSGGLWSFLFMMSKFVEFGDTFFIVLKKKKLIFLHWFHHVTVLWFCWFSFINPHGPARVFGVINMIIHFIMYTYYGVSASGLYKPPKWINISITTLQLSQMVTGISTTSWAYYQQRSGEDCPMSDMQFSVSMAMYASYTVLFGNFFYKTYIASSKSGKASKAE